MYAFTSERFVFMWSEMSNIQPSFVLLILLWPSLELCLETLLFSSELNFNWINPLTQLSYDVLLLHKSFICWNGWHFAESGHLQVDTGHWNMMSYSVILDIYLFPCSMMQGPTFPGLLDTGLARHAACVWVPARPPDGRVQAPGALLDMQLCMHNAYYIGLLLDNMYF